MRDWESETGKGIKLIYTKTISSFLWATGTQTFKRLCGTQLRIILQRGKRSRYFCTNSCPLMVESNSWHSTFYILPACPTSGLSKILRQEKALGREIHEAGRENCFWNRPEVMSRIPTPSPTAAYCTKFECQPKYIFKWQYRNICQNPLNRLCPSNLTIIFLETDFKKT